MEKSSTLFNLGADEQFNERVRFYTEFLDDDVYILQLTIVWEQRVQSFNSKDVGPE